MHIQFFSIPHWSDRSPVYTLDAFGKDQPAGVAWIYFLVFYWFRWPVLFFILGPFCSCYYSLIVCFLISFLMPPTLYFYWRFPCMPGVFVALYEVHNCLRFSLNNEHCTLCWLIWTSQRIILPIHEHGCLSFLCVFPVYFLPPELCNFHHIYYSFLG